MGWGVKTLTEKLTENGGIVYGLFAYFGGQQTSDALLSLIYPTMTVASYILKNKVTAHGGNSGIKFDQKGNILASCINLDTRVTIGSGGLIRDQIKKSGGVAVRSFSPITISPTRSDRMPDLKSVINLVLSRRKSVESQYQSWFQKKPGVDYNHQLK